MCNESITNPLRLGVFSDQRNQDIYDFNTRWKRKKGIAEASSVTDIIDSGKLPFLNVSNMPKAKEIRPGNIISSSIMTTFLQNSLQQNVKFDSDRSVYLTKAFETLRSAKVNPDPNVAYFESAVYFAELLMYDRAVKYFTKATERIDAELVEEIRTTKDSEMLQRKLERMSKEKREKLLAGLDEEHRRRCAEEMERQRQRVRVAHIMLFYVDLQLGLEVDAHLHLRLSLRESCDSLQEYTECLLFAHTSLKQYTRIDGMHDRLVSSSAGPLSEAHIEILHGLLSSDWNPVECYTWLGKRFAEKGDYSASRDFFERARMLPLNSLKETVTKQADESIGKSLTLPFNI